MALKGRGEEEERKIEKAMATQETRNSFYANTPAAFTKWFDYTDYKVASGVWAGYSRVQSANNVHIFSVLRKTVPNKQ